MSWNLLERFIESDHFNNDPSLSVAYLSRYADHVGIHYVLCSKLRRFTYEEIEFFLPQLCHLLISVDNESMALEEFILDLCEESVHGALLTFWLFQSYLHDINSNPHSGSFRTCQRIFNKVQHIVFGGSEPALREKIKENILPVSVLASIVLAAVATPFLPGHAGPLAIAQARKPRPAEDVVVRDVVQERPVEMTRSHSEGSQPPKSRKRETSKGATERKRSSKPAAAARSKNAQHTKPPRQSLPVQTDSRKRSPSNRPSMLTVNLESEARLSSSSLPDFRRDNVTPGPTPPLTAHLDHKASQTSSRRHTHSSRPLTPSVLSRNHKIRLLRSHYFRSETQLLSALEDISNRLVSVPKPARLSALRAELALIAQDLPAEVDIPVICPPSLVDGAAGMSQHHRIVRLNPAEATSLNSADRVPYLLMVEVLRDDFDFDPDTETNQKLLTKLLAEKGTTKRRLFDITDASREIEVEKPDDTGPDSVFEPANGDLGNTALIQDPFEQDAIRKTSRSPFNASNTKPLPPPRSSSGANTTTTLSSLASLSTPRTSDNEIDHTLISPRRTMTLPTNPKSSGTDPPDVSALATHMRTASQMLAQLDSSGSKRPKVEVAAIKAKIIASMQSLEEQSFYTEDGGSGPSFDTIMVNASSSAASHPGTDYLDDVEGLGSTLDPTSPSAAGAARMENDQKTGGVQRRGDRDDPSAATFGEEWTAKKERIRRSSPYGRMPNWDLLSVIVKTGADLRQEAFACQLIEVCAKIWREAEVPVWVKRIRILVTGESSGLIETIANGVSMHSIKRSLTLASIAAGTNPRKRFATLLDHFVKTFGEAGSEGYAAALDAFTRSLAAYSVICYVLQLKDRHNGNLLIDNTGHIIHIDFGFMLSNSPGSMGFEAAPFKLTQEYVDVLGGVGSPAFEEFKRLCKVAFQALRKEAERLVMLVEMMGRESKMPCFAKGVGEAVSALRGRMMLTLSREEAEGAVEELVAKSLGSYYTRLYDTFQYRTQGIY